MSKSDGKSVCIIGVMTCFNRAHLAERYFKSLEEGNPTIEWKHVVVNDGSTDGTGEILKTLPYDITVLEGDGNLYWNHSMHWGFEYAGENILDDACEKYGEENTFLAMLNDDALFYDHSVEKLVNLSQVNNGSVCVGTFEDENGNLTYGGIRLTSKHFVKYMTIPIEDKGTCDTFNGNCVLIPAKVFKQVGNMDDKYIQKFGDFDYGFSMKRAGVKVLHSSEYVGMCNRNKIEGTWEDTSYSRWKRLKVKESSKGLPFSDWFHFVNKNFGFIPALYHTGTSYARILFKR